MPDSVRPLALVPLVALVALVAQLAQLALSAESIVSAQPQRPPSENPLDEQETEGTESGAPASGPPVARPPDGILPIAEIARLEYGPRDRPQVEIVGSSLLVTTASGLVEDHDALSGALIWKLGLPESTFFRPLLLRSDPLELFVASPSGHAVRVRGSDGELLQELELGSPVALAPLIAGSLSIVGTATGEVIAYDIASASERFRIDSGEAPAAMAFDAGLLVISGSAGTLTAIDVEGGAVRWTFRGRAGFMAPASFGVKGDKLYVGDDAGDFYCIGARNGHVRFRWPTGGAIRDRPLVEGKRVYVTSYGNTLYDYDADGGAEQWRVSLPGRPATSAIRVHRRLLVFTFDGVIVEVDPEKGQIGKSWAAPGEVASAPAVLVAAEPPGTETKLGASSPSEATGAEPAPPEAPKWFEGHRIALPLRTGEILLLGYKAPEAKPDAPPGSSEAEPAPKPAVAPRPNKPKGPGVLSSAPSERDTLSRKEDRASPEPVLCRAAELERNLH
jgi:outer membrane protein assembly factor BamB